MSVVVPAGGGRRPLLVFLHGKGGDERSHLHDELLKPLATRADAPVIAFPDGDDAYWHDRAGGDWGRYVREEVPREAAKVADVDLDRIAIGGISMGGFGALNAGRRGGYCAVGAHSPAIFRGAGDTPAGAFDDAEDFARHDVIAEPGDLPEMNLWLDIGAQDPLRPGAEAFARALGFEPRVWPGGHEGAYWRDHWDEYLAFYAEALDTCVASGMDGQAEEAQDGAG